MSDFTKTLGALEDCSKLKDAMASALDKRFGKGKKPDGDYGHRKNFGSCIQIVREYGLGCEADIENFAKALGETGQAADAASFLRKEYAKEWAGAFLDSFDPEDCFTDAKFIERVARFYAQGDYLGAKACGEGWIEIGNGPLTPETKREIMDNAFKNVRAVVAMRACEDGVFIDALAGGDWLVADGIAGKPGNLKEAAKMAESLSGKEKPKAAPRP